MELLKIVSQIGQNYIFSFFLIFLKIEMPLISLGRIKRITILSIRWMVLKKATIIYKCVVASPLLSRLLVRALPSVWWEGGVSAAVAIATVPTAAPAREYSAWKRSTWSCRSLKVKTASSARARPAPTFCLSVMWMLVQADLLLFQWVEKLYCHQIIHLPCHFFWMFFW